MRRGEPAGSCAEGRGAEGRGAEGRGAEGEGCGGDGCGGEGCGGRGLACTRAIEPVTLGGTRLCVRKSGSRMGTPREFSKKSGVSSTWSIGQSKGRRMLSAPPTPEERAAREPKARGSSHRGRERGREGEREGRESRRHASRQREREMGGGVERAARPPKSGRGAVRV